MKGNNWIEWNGRECPVPAGTLVDIRDRDGTIWDAVKARPHDEYSDAAAIFWEHVGEPRNHMIAWCLHQPEQQAWNGESLPPVGCVCEVKRAMDWQKCEIIFISEQHAVMNLEGSEICWKTQSCQFRPIRTEAERKREEILKELRSHVTNFNKTDVLHAIVEVYDAIAAGKIPGVKLL